MMDFTRRIELWHPLTVHLPVAFLLLATGIGLVLLFLKARSFTTYLQYTMLFLLCTGTAMLWLTFYTGNLAYNPVVRTICFPSVLKTHLWWAYVSCYTFSSASVLFLVYFVFRMGNRWLPAITVAVMLFGSAAMSYTGHLGASLVYEQGAGVRNNAKDCR